MRLLAQFLEESGELHKDFASATGLAPSQVHNYRHGIYKPKFAQRRAIATHTGGFIPEESWDEPPPRRTKGEQPIAKAG